jgi:hypothetical protein
MRHQVPRPAIGHGVSAFHQPPPRTPDSQGNLLKVSPPHRSLNGTMHRPKPPLASKVGRLPDYPDTGTTPALDALPRSPTITHGTPRTIICYPSGKVLRVPSSGPPTKERLLQIPGSNDGKCLSTPADRNPAFVAYHPWQGGRTEDQHTY